MHRLTFDLIQHTPIIHFQSEYRGATLRASEVKPKLDKYLLKYHAQHIAECDKSIHGEGDTQEKRVSLNYKLSFEARDVITWPANRKNAPMYFGNTGDKKNKDFTFARGGVKMTLLIYDKKEESKLPSWLKSKDGREAICDFFMLHNFGSRQSKGYGSFAVKEKGVDLWERGMFCYDDLGFQIKTRPYGGMVSKFKLSQQEEESSKFYGRVFSAINYFYKSLRSGLNEQRKRKGGDDFEQVFYMKPMIYHYAKRLGLQWDKRSIKQAIVPQQQEEHDAEHEVEEPLLSPDDPKFDFRDMFGFSTVEKWGSKEYLARNNKKGKRTEKKTKDEEDNALIIEKEYLQRGATIIPRMKSPIQLKPLILKGETNQYELWVFMGIYPADVGLEEVLATDVKTKVTGRGGILKEDGCVELSFKPDVDFPEFLDQAFETGGFGFVDDEAQEMSTSHNEEGDQIEALLLDIYQQLQKLYKDE